MGVAAGGIPLLPRTPQAISDAATTIPVAAVRIPQFDDPPTPVIESS
jgi:hypothetical protein